MPARIESFLESIAVLFVAGRVAPIASAFTEPLALHVEDSFLALQTRAAQEAALSTYHRLQRRLGITAIVPRITAVELPRRQRFRVWVEFVNYRGSERLSKQTRAVFYGRYEGDRLQIEMINIISFAHPHLKRLIPASSWTA